MFLNSKPETRQVMPSRQLLLLCTQQSIPHGAPQEWRETTTRTKLPINSLEMASANFPGKATTLSKYRSKENLAQAILIIPHIYEHVFIHVYVNMRSPHDIGTWTLRATEHNDHLC